MVKLTRVAPLLMAGGAGAFAPPRVSSTPPAVVSHDHHHPHHHHALPHLAFSRGRLQRLHEAATDDDGAQESDEGGIADDDAADDAVDGGEQQGVVEGIVQESISVSADEEEEAKRMKKDAKEEEKRLKKEEKRLKKEAKKEGMIMEEESLSDEEQERRRLEKEAREEEKRLRKEEKRVEKEAKMEEKRVKKEEKNKLRQQEEEGMIPTMDQSLEEATDEAAMKEAVMEETKEEEETPQEEEEDEELATTAEKEAKKIEKEAMKEEKKLKKEEKKLRKREEKKEKANKKYVVVGGGWGGWGAAKALCESGMENVDVTLIDALPDPTGATPYLSPTGKPVEAGTRGFWKDYPNIDFLVNQLGLDEDDIFTPYTNSSFYSPDGLEATAPVFAEATLDNILGGFPIVGDALKTGLAGLNGGNGGGDKFPQLPSPLGQVLATVPYFERLPLKDRASMVGLLLATIDCLGGDEETKRQYDRLTAHELFLRFRLSERLVEDFIKPTLLVGLFKPPEELSALVVMELLYYYALAHQDSFDVRWIKNGTVSDSLIRPLAERLTQEDKDGRLNVLGGCRVKEISLEKGEDGKLHASKLSYLDTRSGKVEVIDDIDGIVLALGCQGMQSVVSSSPDLARLPEFSRAASLKGIDVISCRLYFDRKVATRSPANVFSRFEELRGAGGTFFMLDQMQDGSLAELWGLDGEDEDVDEDSLGSVVACDFYNAGGLMSLKDEDIVKILTDELLPSAVSRFADAKLVDSWVGKYAGVVSWFSPGSYALRPPLEGAGNGVLPNVKCAGDWVRMGEREHGAKGLCQERAYVSGFEAANSLMRVTASDEKFQAHEVLDVREDEMQFKLGVEVNRKVMSFVPRFWTR